MGYRFDPRDFGNKIATPTVAPEQSSRVVEVEDERDSPDPFGAARADVGATPAMVSEAVEDVLAGAPPETADVLRRLWTVDPQTDVARLLFQTSIGERGMSGFVNWDRPKVKIREALDADQMLKCSEYAPEYDLVFLGSVNHDHPMFSACRKIDHHILQSKFPPGIRYADVGGRILHHVERGDTNCVVVAPDADAKDPMRATLIEAALRRIASREGDDKPQVMARSILAGENKYVVREKAQLADLNVSCSMSCHVYDIPIDDWPAIMERWGVLVHEGSMHFSSQFFFQSSGVLPFSGARFTVDGRKDVFAMGLGNSYANWYEHKWSQFVKYGADQVLHGKTHAYSYHITERRGDTIFFRIMQIDSDAMPNKRQVYALPGVEMAEVRGFAVAPLKTAAQAPFIGNRGVGALTPARFLFPARLWSMMVSYAELSYVRQGLDYQKMYNYYRTVVPAQKINSVLVSGGESVSVDQLPALIVNAAATAMANVMLNTQSAAAVTSQIMRDRSELEEWTLVKVADTFYAAVCALGLLPISPFLWLGKKIEKLALRALSSAIVTWKPEAVYRRIPLSLIADTKAFDYTYLPPSQPGFNKYIDGKVFSVDLNVFENDPDYADALLRTCSEHLTDTVRSKLEALVTKAEQKEKEIREAAEADKMRPSASVVRSDVGSDAPTYVTSRTADAEKQVHLHRLAAIKEAITQSELEEQQLQAAFTDWYQDLVPGGRPSLRVCTERREEMGNPDVWWVSNGVLQHSLLGADPHEFGFSGVYTPVPDGHGGPRLRAVMESVYTGPDSKTGLEVTRIHHVLKDESYTGWALTADALKIFNGREVRETMKQALTLPREAFGYAVVVHEGVPGCGKTTSIVKRYRHGKDMVLCPVKQSLLDTRQKLKEKYPSVRDDVWRNNTRTLDSLLVNWSRVHGRLPSFEEAMGDECFITHAGKWYAALALLGVQVFHAYGDQLQINAVARVDVAQTHSMLQADHSDMAWITHRCAAEITAVWAARYGYKARTSVQAKGEVRWVKQLSSSMLKRDNKGNPLFLCLAMFQADKKTIATMFPGEKVPIHTTHEAQGKTYEQVILFNFEARARSADDKFYLFEVASYVNVACSRCRTSLIYVKNSNNGDLVTRWIEEARDPRAIMAVKDVDSGGQAMRHFK